MTYSHEKNPWTMAQRIDLYSTYEMTIASAHPKLIPLLTVLLVRLTKTFRSDMRFS